MPMNTSLIDNIPVQEGFIPIHGHKVWYRRVGEIVAGVVPLLCLHGGQGAPHDYLEPLEAIAKTGRAVIFYDQLGCGNSDHVHDPSLWTIDLFVNELREVRKALGLKDVHILGQSWGGMLTLRYALTKPKRLVSLILADSLASMTQWVSEANRLRKELPLDIQKTLLKHEKEGTTDGHEYEDAVMVFYKNMFAGSIHGLLMCLKHFKNLQKHLKSIM